MKQHFDTLASYNSWANRQLYDAVALLPDALYRADRSAFFGSLHGTLNHVLVGDRAWLARLTGEAGGPSQLDEILYEDFGALRSAREAEDARIERYLSRLDGPHLMADFTYANLSGDQFTQPLFLILAHFFNHQTHHRGQAHTLLTQLGREAPPLDLIYFLRE